MARKMAVKAGTGAFNVGVDVGTKAVTEALLSLWPWLIHAGFGPGLPAFNS